MGDILSIVSKPMYRKWDRRWRTEYARPLGPGELLPRDDYEEGHPYVDLYLERGDRIFLVTVRPGPRLWLLAVYEDVERRHDGWYAAHLNRVPITDIMSLRSKLRFNTGHGLRGPDDKLANALQTPRLLTEADVAHLERAIARSRVTLHAPRRPSTADEALEGEHLKYEVTRYSRSPLLARKCLDRDGCRCRGCGFAPADVAIRDPQLRESLARILHVHHVDPLHDRPETSTPLPRLLTLCPTCHAVVHALARTLDLKRGLDLALLREHYKPSVTRARGTSQTSRASR